MYPSSSKIIKYKRPSPRNALGSQYECSGAAKTKQHGLGDLHNIHSFYHKYGEDPGSRHLWGFFFLRFLLGVQTGTFSLTPHMIFPLCLSVSQSPLIRTPGTMG